MAVQCYAIYWSLLLKARLWFSLFCTVSELATSATAELYPDWIADIGWCDAQEEREKSLYSSQDDYDIVLQVANGYLARYHMGETKKQKRNRS